MFFKRLAAAFFAVVIWHSPVTATTPQASCAATAETHTTLNNPGWYNIQGFEEHGLRQLRDITAVTIEMLGFFNSTDHCLGQEGSALVCATADRLLIEIDHQYNQSMEKWQSEIARPPLVLQVVNQFKTLRARYTTRCVAPRRSDDPA
jgi:hypothetical protein